MEHVYDIRNTMMQETIYLEQDKLNKLQALTGMYVLAIKNKLTGKKMYYNESINTIKWQNTLSEATGFESITSAQYMAHQFYADETSIGLVSIEGDIHWL